MNRLKELEDLKAWKAIVLRSLPDCYEEMPFYMKRLDNEIKELEESNEGETDSDC